ncbi:MAG: electron transfer flavoprotein subunit beta/FixA family protein [Planctomycetota bacterium]
MRIAVCLKLVPASTSDIRVAPGGQSLLLAGVEMAVSLYDEYALETALCLREALPGSTIHALSIGGEECVKCLQHALALGVDSVLHIRAPGADSRAAAKLAAAALRLLELDLVLCGRQACDDDLWFFPGALGEALGWPHLSAVSSVAADGDKRAVECRRRFEGGEQFIHAPWPVVISCDRGPHEPRIPMLKGRLAAKKMPVPVKTTSELGIAAADLTPALAVLRYAPPAQRTPKKVFTCPPTDAAAELVRLLREEEKLI